MTEEPEEGIVSEAIEQEEGQEIVPLTEEAEQTDAGSSEAIVPEPLPAVVVPDRYTLGRCKLNFSITMLEEDKHPDGRRMLIGVRNDEDVPLTALVRAADLPALLPYLITLQAQLEEDLPRRQETMREHLEEQRRKQLAAKSTSKRPVSTASTDVQSAMQESSIAASPAQEERPASHQGVNRAKTRYKTRQQQEDESPFEQMTLF